MKILVSNSSILIEFSKRELLDKMFHLEFQFVVPDLLYHEELMDLSTYTRQDLLDFGLRVESLDADGVQKAIAYQSEWPALSLVDSFALALAAYRGWHLLTEDRTMRKVAQFKSIAHRDALWVIDNMLDAGIMSVAQVAAVLEAMRDDAKMSCSRS